uniref:AIP3 domain-containing protein n=1 Tax=Mesocestoides corti TaxID=53468 RepID=A0A5K3FLG4_MESCO
MIFILMKGFQRAAAARAQSDVRLFRTALSNLKHEHLQMKVLFGKEIQNCERQISVQLKKYERKKGLQQPQPFYDTRIHKVRVDRLALDNALAAYQTTWSSLIGQLADLEGVIEETGNDVLKGRCRITPQMVSALEDRLQLATSAIEFCCGKPAYQAYHHHTAEKLLKWGSILLCLKEITNYDLIPFNLENDPLLRKSIWQHAENEMDSAEQEIQILGEQLEQLSDLRERSARLNGTIVTLKRLAKVNVSARQNEPQLHRLRALGGILHPAAADNGSAERKRLMATIRLLQPDHDERMRSIEIQEALRERRKRVFRDPPIFKGPAKALLLNGIHISPIWPEGFSRKSQRSATLMLDPPDTPTVTEETPEAPNSTANLPQPLRVPISTVPTARVLVGRLKNPNAPKAKRSAHVTFNMQVYVDGETQPLPLNCILDEDTAGVLRRRRPVPALPGDSEGQGEGVPPTPPPRLTSQVTAPATVPQMHASPVKLLRYENMEMFLKNIQPQAATELNMDLLDQA